VGVLGSGFQVLVDDHPHGLFPGGDVLVVRLDAGLLIVVLGILTAVIERQRKPLVVLVERVVRREIRSFVGSPAATPFSLL